MKGTITKTDRYTYTATLGAGGGTLVNILLLSDSVVFRLGTWVEISSVEDIAAIRALVDRAEQHILQPEGDD